MSQVLSIFTTPNPIAQWVANEMGVLTGKGQGLQVDSQGDGSQFTSLPYIFGSDNTLMELLVAAIAIKLSKTPEGLRVVRDVAVHYIDNIGRIVSTLEASSAANWLTCAINQRLCARILKNMGMITTNECNEYMSWTSWVVGAMIAKGFVTDTLSSLSSMGNIGQWAKALS